MYNYPLHTCAIVIAILLSMGKRGATPTMADKRSRLNAFGRESHISKRAIATLCGNIRQEGLPEATSRGSLYRARKGLVNVTTPYGKLVETFAAPTKKQPNNRIGIQNPLAMLVHCAFLSPTYAALLRATMEATPCEPDQPWSLILYQDGIDPSDALSKHHTRKSHVFYWTVKEFGMSVLHQEQCWFTPAIVRVDVLKEQPGGVPWLTQLILRQFFDPNGDDAEIAGVDLELHGGGSMTVYLKLRILLADEPGVKEVLACKGHAGHKCCVLCKNAVLHKISGGGIP